MTLRVLMVKSWSQHVVRLVDADGKVDTIDAVERTSPRTIAAVHLSAYPLVRARSVRSAR